MSTARFGFKTSKLRALWGIRTRLAMLALILVVPLMLDRVRVLEDSRAKQLAQIANELSELAKHTADAQREIISTVQAVIKSSAYIYAAASQQGRGCAVMRASLRVDLPWISSISVVSRNGEVQCSTRQEFVGFNVSDREYFKQALELHEFVVSDYILSRTTGIPTVVAAYPVSAINGGEEAVIVAAVDLRWMSQLFASRGGRSGMSVVLVDGRGTILAAPPENATVIGQPLKDASLLEAVAHRKINLDRDSGSISFESADGEMKAVSFARVTGTRARIIASIDQSVMLGDVKREIRAAYIQLGFVGLLALLGAWFAGEVLIVRPVRMMTEMANRLGRGELSARATSRTLPREFVPLAKAFDAMASQLSEREREMVAANDRLTVIASLDMVSGLANRRGFQSRLEFEWMKSLQSNAQLSLLMIDVDHFKLFNDAYGHPEGDACLSRLGEVLAITAATYSGFAARYGGEEFCLLLPNSEPNLAMQVGEQVRATVEALAIPHVAGANKTVTVSVGVATITPNESQPQTDLIEAADAALYAAKRLGRNAVVEHGLSAAGVPPVSLAS